MLISCLFFTLDLIQAQTTSGLAPGERPGPYSFVVSQGEKRGQLHCFVCEAEDRVMAILFARDTTAQTGKLASRLDEILLANPQGKPSGWVTLLEAESAGIDAKAIKWARRPTLLPFGKRRRPDCAVGQGQKSGSSPCIHTVWPR